jgi:hypothetical protein
MPTIWLGMPKPNSDLCRRISKQVADVSQNECKLGQPSNGKGQGHGNEGDEGNSYERVQHAAVHIGAIRHLRREMKRLDASYLQVLDLGEASKSGNSEPSEAAAKSIPTSSCGMYGMVGVSSQSKLRPITQCVRHIMPVPLWVEFGFALWSSLGLCLMFNSV